MAARGDEPLNSATLQRTDWRIAMGVFVVALAVHLVFLFNSPDQTWPHSSLYEGDAPTWVEWANALDNGQPFEFNLPLRSPAVAYLMSYIHPGRLPASFVPFKALWCTFTAMACSLAYLAGVISFGRRVAILGSGLCAFSFGTYLISTSINNEALYCLALMAILFTTLRFVVQPRLPLAAALAVLHGAAMLIRPEHLLLFAILLAYMGIQSRFADSKSRFGLLTAIAVICGVTVMPWSIHGSLATQRFNTITIEEPDYDHANPRWTADARAFLNALPAFARDANFRYLSFLAQRAGKPQVSSSDVHAFFLEQFGYIPEPLSNWTLLSLKGPVDFAIANHPGAKGGFSKDALLREGDVNPNLMLARPDHLRLFNHGYAVGLSYITSDFTGWLKSVGAKLWNFFDGVALGLTSRNIPFGYEGVRRPVDLLTPERTAGALVWQAIVLLSLVGGVVRIVSQKRGGIWLVVIGYKLAVTIFFYGYARQAVSILPFFLILSALAIDAILFRLPLLARLDRNAVVALGLTVLAIMLAIDFTGSLSRPQLAVTGPVDFTPQWGNEAFVSTATLHIAPAPTVVPH